MLNLIYASLVHWIRSYVVRSSETFQPSQSIELNAHNTWTKFKIVLQKRQFKYCRLLILITRNLQKQPVKVFYKKGDLENFKKFTGKNLWRSLLFKTIVSLRPATLSKKRLQHRSFSANILKFLVTLFLQNTSRRLSL